MNIALGFTLVLFSFVMLLAAYRFFGKGGILAWIAIASVLANIQVEKTIEIFGITATLGNGLYGSIFLATDIINEYYGETAARRSVWLGFAATFTMIVAMQLALLFTPGPEDTIQPHLAAVFNTVPRIAAASMAAYIASQFLDVRLFAAIRARFPSDRMLWLRNNIAACTSQLVDTAIFVTIAFAGTLPAQTLWEIYLTTYLFKAAVAIADTPFMYLSKLIKPAE